MVRIRFSVWLVSGYAHVFVPTLSCHSHTPNLWTHDPIQPILNRNPKHQLACRKNNEPNCRTNLPVETRYKITYLRTCIFRRSAISDAWLDATRWKQKFRTHYQVYQPSPTRRSTQLTDNSGVLMRTLSSCNTASVFYQNIRWLAILALKHISAPNNRRSVREWVSRV